MDPNIQPNNNGAMPPNQPPVAPPQPVAVPMPTQPEIPAQPQPIQVAQPQAVQPVQAPVVQPQVTLSQVPMASQPVAQPGMAPVAPPVPPQQPVNPQQPIQQQQPPQVGGPQAAPAGYKHPPNKVMKIITIVITVLAILLCSYGALHVFKVRKEKYGFAADADKQRKEQVKKAVEASKPDSEKRTDGKLNLTKLFDAEYASHDQDIKVGMNEQVNLADGFSFMVTGVEGNWQKTGDYETPAGPGKEFIKVSVVIGNRAEKGTMSFYSSKLELANTKGGKQQEVSTDTDDLPNNPLGGYSSINLNPGDQRSGWIVYEVDKGETPIHLVYEKKGYSCRANDNKDCLMKGSVKLQ